MTINIQQIAMDELLGTRREIYNKVLTDISFGAYMNFWNTIGLCASNCKINDLHCVSFKELSTYMIDTLNSFISKSSNAAFCRILNTLVRLLYKRYRCAEFNFEEITDTDACYNDKLWCIMYAYILFGEGVFYHYLVDESAVAISDPTALRIMFITGEQLKNSVGGELDAKCE